MSRTHKDKPWKHAEPESQWDYDQVSVPYESTRFEYEYDNGKWTKGEVVPCTRYMILKQAGVKTKKKRSHTERNWMTTPMWWIREMMNQPQRVRSKQWERQVVEYDTDELEDCDPPYIGRRPHLYYW